MEVINAIGRRKAAIARIYLNEGKGKIVVNNKDSELYFPDARFQYIIRQPLNLLEVNEKYDIKVNLTGGGSKGKAEALRLAIARAFIKIDPECKSSLRANGFVTRDPRSVERKKPGMPKARKRFQFSKR
mgnify:CR=1 FL=1